MGTYLLFQSPSSERFKIQKQLENDVHNIILAETLGEATQALASRPVDAILVDGFNAFPRGARGPDMLAQLPTGTIPVIASSDDKDSWKTNLQSPLTRFLAKNDDGWNYRCLKHLLALMK